SSEQFIGCGRFVQFRFHNFTASFNADRQGQGENHARLGSIALARALATARPGEITAPGCAKSPAGRSGAVPTVLKIECVLAVEPWVRIKSAPPRQEWRKTLFYSLPTPGIR